eukprot:5974418-Amphidinium_carterae.1
MIEGALCIPVLLLFKLLALVALFTVQVLSLPAAKTRSIGRRDYEVPKSLTSSQHEWAVDAHVEGNPKANSIEFFGPHLIEGNYKY